MKTPKTSLMQERAFLENFSVASTCMMLRTAFIKPAKYFPRLMLMSFLVSSVNVDNVSPKFLKGYQLNHAILMKHISS